MSIELRRHRVFLIKLKVEIRPQFSWLALLTRGLDVKDYEKNRGYKNKQNSCDEAEIINLHSAESILRIDEQNVISSKSTIRLGTRTHI